MALTSADYDAAYFASVYRGTSDDGKPTHIFRPKGRDVRQVFEDHGFSAVRESYFPHRLPRLTRHLRMHPSYLALFRKD